MFFGFIFEKSLISFSDPIYSKTNIKLSSKSILNDKNKAARLFTISIYTQVHT